MAKIVYNAKYNVKDDKGKATGESIPLSAEKDFGDNLEASVKLFGEKVVHSAFLRQSVISLQGVMRSAQKAGNDVQEAATKWVPGVSRVAGKSITEKATALFDDMTPEQQESYIANLQEIAKRK